MFTVALFFVTDYPYVKGKPQLSTRYNESTNEFLFQCEFFEHARDNVYYFIEWQHNNQTEVKRNVSEIGLNSTVVTLTSISISHFGFMSNVSWPDISNGMPKIFFIHCLTKCKKTKYLIQAKALFVQLVL